jgi:F-type H+-transporting ATPase subunit a
MISRFSTTYVRYYRIIFTLLVLVFGVARIASANEGHENDTISAQDSGVAHTEESAHAEAHGTEGKFQPGPVIMEHIKDAHDWHLWGHTSVHLPVILYTDKGMEFFSSGKFNHGHDAYTGKHYTYKLEHEKVKVVTAEGILDEEASKNVYDFSITKNVASLLISVLIIILIFTSIAKAYTTRKGQAPKGLQSAMEPIIIFVRDEIAKPNLGDRHEKYMPYLLTVFFFIWFNNMLGLIPFFPGGANVTGNIAVTMTLAVVTLLITNINANKNYWQHIFWMPGVPVPVKLLLAPIEFVGVFTKPIALMIRLFANITAGHILVLSLVCLIFIFKSLAVAAVSVPFVAAISLIELLVAFIQAFIFTILSALYIGMATEEHHHEEHH